MTEQDKKTMADFLAFLAGELQQGGVGVVFVDAEDPQPFGADEFPIRTPCVCEDSSCLRHDRDPPKQD